MKGAKTVRKLHMWVGIILSIFILIEAVTGFILANPQLAGVERNSMIEGGRHQQFRGSGDIPTLDGEPGLVPNRPPVDDDSVLSVAKMLHQGTYGAVDLRWLVAVIGVGVAFLTVTGVYLSVKPLGTQSRNRKRRASPVNET